MCICLLQPNPVWAQVWCTPDVKTWALVLNVCLCASMVSSAGAQGVHALTHSCFVRHIQVSAVLGVFR